MFIGLFNLYASYDNKVEKDVVPVPLFFIVYTTTSTLMSISLDYLTTAETLVVGSIIFFLG